MKIIIHSELPASVAMSCVSRVIQDGMVSHCRGQDQYCFVTTFTRVEDKVIVTASRNVDTHTFRVFEQAIAETGAEQ